MRRLSVRTGRHIRPSRYTIDGASRAGRLGADRNMRSGRQAPGLRRADFEALYQRHSREVWALVYARWLNADVARDIAQETFLRLWKQWEDGEKILNPRAWLLRVARNLAEDHGKSAFRRNGTQSPQTMNGVQGHDPLPLECMALAETFGQLRKELEQLPAGDREILTLRYALEYDTNQIAELLKINP